MIKIITDSSAYLKKQEAASMGVRVVPISYTVENRGFSESYSDQNGNFADLIKSNADTSTSQPNSAAFLSCFEEEMAHGYEILCITISSRLSGTYSSAYTAAKQTESDQIVVIDSQLTAGGLFMLIEEAKELVDAGKTLEEIKTILIEKREKIQIAFSVDDMDPLRRSGRIHFIRMSVGTILNVRPILLLQDGGVVFDSTVHGRIERIRALTHKVPDNAKKVVVNYIENKNLASTVYNVIKEQHPDIPVKLQKLGPVLGIHLGLQVIGVSVNTD